MTEEGPKIKNVLIQRGRAVARIEHKIDELDTFRPISTGLIKVWSTSKIIVSAVSISVGREQEIAKYYGVRLHSNSLGQYFRYCECYLDHDEIDEFLNGIELVKSSMMKMHRESAESKQVYYSSKDEVHVGFFQDQESSEQVTYLCISGPNGETFRFRDDEQGNKADAEDSLQLESGDPPPLPPALSPTEDFRHLISCIRKGQEIIGTWMQSSD